MMRAVLAFDASDGTAQAASLAASMRWPAGSALRVVAVIEPSALLVPAMGFAPGQLLPSPEIDAEITDYLTAEIDGLVRRLASPDLHVEGDVLRGRPATLLVEEAGRFGADLIIAGSRGHGPIASLVLGSVSAELVDQAPCPVLIARGTAGKRVLFASDGSASAGQAEQLLATWPFFDGTSVRVLSVAEVARPWHTGIAPTMYRQAMDAYSRDLEEARTAHEAVAERAAERLQAAGRTTDAIVRTGDAAAEIIDETASWQADLVVVGSRGLTGVSRLVLGSVARNVLHGSRSSVLIVREGAAPDAAG